MAARTQGSDAVDVFALPNSGSGADDFQWSEWLDCDEFDTSILNIEDSVNPGYGFDVEAPPTSVLNNPMSLDIDAYNSLDFDGIDSPPPDANDVFTPRPEGDSRAHTLDEARQMSTMHFTEFDSNQPLPMDLLSDGLAFETTSFVRYARADSTASQAIIQHLPPQPATPPNTLLALHNTGNTWVPLPASDSSSTAAHQQIAEANS